VSVPVLWDKKRGTIVNNESSEIIRMFNSAFDAFTNERTDYYPAELRGEIDRINEVVYSTVNNGVYRTGFAVTQDAYEESFRALFKTLDELEKSLSRQRYLVGNRLTEALGNNGVVVSEVLPELELLLGKQPAPPPLGLVDCE
jgi:putative glutathione S-transferase